MKKRTLLTTLAFLALLPASSQTREEALAEFDWFTGFVSRNYPGYKIKTQGKEREWKTWTDSLRSSIAQRPDTLPCLIDEYIQRFKDIIAHDPQSEWKDYLQELTDSMENHLGDYVLRPGMQRLQLVRRDTVYQHPRRIGLLIHGRNASSAEQYILEAKESEKVVLFGNERTSGTLDLSNVFAITSPSGWLKLYIPTTRSCRWPDIVIDGKGIAPQIPIPYEESQIEALQERDGIGEEIRYIERVLRGLPCPSAAEQ